MTLQDKINKLPLSIDVDGLRYELDIYNNREKWYLSYEAYIPEYKRTDDRIYDRICSCESTKGTMAENLEELVDRALKEIENKEWEK